jgi:hypothetical protein
VSRASTLPPDEARMWRRSLAQAHPDSGGSHELFVWCSAVKDTLCPGIISLPRDEPDPLPPKPYNQPPVDAAERVAERDACRREQAEAAQKMRSNSKAGV